MRWDASGMGAAGFVEIGFDQYARGHDRLAQALAAGRLHRNFMGFSASRTDALLGLGVSAIGDNRAPMHRTRRTCRQYEARVLAGELPLQRGHALDATDLRIRTLLWNLLTHSHTTLDAADRAARWWPDTHAACWVSSMTA